MAQLRPRRHAQHVVNAWSWQHVLFELYRYAPGPAESIPKHAHEDYQFCLSLDWPGEYSYRGTYYAVPAGSLSVIHPGEMHAARDTKNRQTHATFRVMYTNPVLLQSIAAEVSGRHTSLPYFTDPVIVDLSLAQLFLKCHLATESSTPRLECESLLMSTLSQFLRRYADARPLYNPIRPERQRIKRVRDYLHAHAAENISLDHLAYIAGLSPYHLLRLFRREVGLPPHRYHMQLRVARAKTLLAQGLPIGWVAQVLGFADQSHLTRHFKRLVQVTPGQYRRQRRRNVQDTII
jgi:AraC-like DNA-binding protein